MPNWAQRARRAKKSMGMKRAGSRLMVLQSLMCSMPKPEAVMSMPPTSDTSVISSWEMSDCESSASP